MSAGSSEIKTPANRHLGVIAVVCVSLILAAATSYIHFLQILSGGNVPKEQRFYEGSVKDGEFWFRVSRASGNPLAPTMTTRLMRINLETGVETDTEYTFLESHVLPVWVDKSLFVYTASAIYEVEGSVNKLEPAPFKRCVSPPFHYHDQMTVVYETDDLQEPGSNEFVRLAHWVDGKWVVGRKILLPGPGRYWYDDPERGRKSLLPRTSDPGRRVITPGTVYYFPYSLWVIPAEQRMHLFITLSSGAFAAYRDGFEFAEPDPEQASALAPENAPWEVSGWEPILPERADDDWLQMAWDGNGLQFTNADRGQSSTRFARCQPGETRYEMLNDASRLPDERVPWIATDASTGRSYVIYSNSWWGSATVSRIENGTFQQPHLIIPGFKNDYVRQWLRVCLMLLSVWLIAMLALLLGASWMTRDSTVLPISTQVRCASLWKRILALFVDGILVATTACVLWNLFLWQFSLAWPTNQKSDLADTLADLEWTLRAGNLKLLPQVLHQSALDWVNLPLELNSPFFGILVASVVPLVLTNIFLEGRYGFTPGKWLLGLRTVRTTLRPCGFARALLRNVLLWVDMPLMMVPVPAAVSIMYSNNRQRTGDRVADTVVVERT